MTPFRPFITSAGAVAPVVLIALGCSACAAAPVTSPSPTAGVEEPAASVPSVSPGPSVSESTGSADGREDPADPSTWVIAFDGIGPVSVGQPIEEAAARLGAYTEGDRYSCPVRYFSVEGGPELWLVHPSDSVQMVLLNDYADPTAVSAHSPKTVEGIGIGSTRPELLAAYPDIVPTDPAGADPSFEHFAVAGPVNHIDFELSPEKVIDGIVVWEGQNFPPEVCG